MTVRSAVEWLQMCVNQSLRRLDPADALSVLAQLDDVVSNRVQALRRQCGVNQEGATMDEFAYGLGDTLVHRTALVSPVPPNPSRLFVLERWSQQCPGGVQRHYLLSEHAYSDEAEGRSSHPFKALEQELAPYSDWLKARMTDVEGQSLRNRERIASIDEKLVALKEMQLRQKEGEQNGEDTVKVADPKGPAREPVVPQWEK